MSAFKRLVPALVLLGTVTAISAAPDTSTPTAPTGSTTPAKPADLTPAEMHVRAAAIDLELKEDYRHALSLRERAQKMKDVIKLSCVNDKLVQIKAQMNIAEQATTKLEVALDKGSDDRNTLFVDLTTAGDSVRHLREEAVACLGEPELFKQESGIEVTRPEIPDDPTVIDPYGTDGVVEVEPPGYASPFH